VNFVLDQTATADYFGDGHAAGFYTPTGGDALPTVLKNTTGTTLNPEAVTIGPWPADLLLLHPGPTGDYSVVRFTAPVSATYAVTGEFVAMGNYSGVTDDSVSLTGPGPSSTSLYSTTSTSSPHIFSFDQAMTAGQSLDFAVGLGPQGQFNYDSTGFNATITTPEPGFYSLFALCLTITALIAAIWRKKSA
jgi:hypothetical protein